jgi:hypothetical protein
VTFPRFASAWPLWSAPRLTLKACSRSTHALVSGLLGAADQDGNGEVAFEEVCRTECWERHGFLDGVHRGSGLGQLAVGVGTRNPCFIGPTSCHDDFTELHAFKHHRAIFEEFHATRDPWRWLHLVCGAQASAISFGKSMTVYEEYLELLHAA